LSRDQFLTALLFIAIAVAACFSPAQNDTWWHLRAGADAWRTGRVPLLDTFSHTAYGASWPNQEWLGELILYGLYRLGGLPLMTAAAATLVTVSWWLIWRLTPVSIPWRIGLCAMAILPSAREWSLRPKVFTSMFVALTLVLLARRRWVWLPFLFLLWANIHGGVMLGVIIVVAAGMGQAVAQRRVVTPLAWTGAACILATAVTPLGFSLWPEIVRSLGRIQQYGIDEWQSTALFDPAFLPFWTLSAALVGLTVAANPWRRHPESLTSIAPSFALLPLAMRAHRNVAPAVMVALPVIGAFIAQWPTRSPEVNRRERPRTNVLLACIAVICAAAGVTYAWSLPVQRLGWEPISPAIAHAVSTCPERLYNRYDDGGFLIWFAPTNKVFLDSRQDPYPPDLIRTQQHVEMSGDYENLFQRYSIRCAFLPAGSAVATRLKAAGWLEEYADSQWIVFVRPGIVALAVDR